MAIMFGDTNGVNVKASGGKIRKTWDISGLTTAPTELEFGNGKTVLVSDVSPTYYKADGTSLEKTWSAEAVYAVAEIKADNYMEIEINPDTFPGSYYVTGDTFARSETTGKDEFFQLIIPKAKMLSEVTLTMEAEGDPSTFNMNMKVLRPKTGPMMKLVKYDVADDQSQG